LRHVVYLCVAHYAPSVSTGLVCLPVFELG
jgi:hypothetical protein